MHRQTDSEAGSLNEAASEKNVSTDEFNENRTLAKTISATDIIQSQNVVVSAPDEEQTSERNIVDENNDKSNIVVDNSATLQTKDITSNFPTKINTNSLVSKVWVVRLLSNDKYGMGFLFNTGNVCVKFNDSTKLVMSADGTVLQYTGRRNGQKEYISHRYGSNSYPEELQKKVNLLGGFKEQLLKKEAANKKNAFGFKHKVKNTPIFTTTTSLTPHATAPDENHDPIVLNQDLLFVKRWLRRDVTMYIQLSDNTTQAVNCDCSELLLSTEHKVVTHVNKQGQRVEFTSDNLVMTGPPTDLAKWQLELMVLRNYFHQKDATV